MTIALPAELADRRRITFDFTWPVLFAFVALLCVLIVLPISWLVYYSFTRRHGDAGALVHARELPHAVQRAGVSSIR